MGKQIAKGIKFAHELIQQTPLLDDPVKYLSLLHELLEKEHERVSHTGDSDPHGAVLSGMQIVMNRVKEESAKLSGP